MDEETAKKVQEQLFEISSLVSVLRHALDNPEYQTDYTMYYAKYVDMLEQKLNKIYVNFYKE